ncbi:MAG: glycosyltransferase family 1 protein [Rhodocyclaceae bacterium]|nr:MAG: glycosyltransferase family 1 protein [Rhodocyclaceae bacterium]
MSAVVRSNAAKPPALLYLNGKANPVVSALAAQGVEIVTDNWQPDAALTARLIGVWVNFYHLLQPGEFLRVRRLRRQLRAAGVPFMVWNRDAPGYLNKAAWRLHLLSAAQPVDLYATHAVDERYRFGRAEVYFPNAASIERYNLSGVSLETLRDPAYYAWDVSCFCGMTPRRPEHHDRIRFFAALSERLLAKGCKIRFVDTETESLSLPQQIELIQKSRINLNYGATCDVPGQVPSGMPERVFGIPACGGFLLSDHRSHAAEDFMPGREWADFRTLDEAEMKIEHFLARFDESRDIAEAAHRRVMAQHTYAHRAQRLMDLLAASRAGLVAGGPRSSP